MLGVFELRVRNKISRIRKSRNGLATGIKLRVSPGMVEMQMSIDADRHFTRPNSGDRAQRFPKRPLARDAIHRGMFSRPLLADPGLDQNLLRACFDEHAIHVHANAILFVRRTRPRPEVARHHAEHRATVDTKFSVRNNLDPIITELHWLCARLSLATLGWSLGTRSCGRRFAFRRSPRREALWPLVCGRRRMVR